MKKVYVVVVETEDCETYTYVYKNKPTEDQVKDLFFAEHDGTYDPDDWDFCITCEITEYEVI